MNINFKQFDKTTYPYLDDSYVGNYIPVCYGKIAAVKLTPINSNLDTDNSGISAIYRMPEGMSNYGSAYIKDNDTWKTASVSSADYNTGLITISNGRSSSGTTKECKLVDCYGYMFDGHSYARQILQHWYAAYGNIQYTDSNFNKTEWETELDDARYQCDIGLLLDDYKGGDNKARQDYFNKKVFEISTMGGKMFALVDYDRSGKITARLKDYDRLSTGIFASVDIKNASKLPGSTSKDSAYSKITGNYYKNYAESDDKFLSIEDTTYQQYVKQNFRITQSYTDESYLINDDDEKSRISEIALELKETPVKFTVDLYDDESSDQDVMGIRRYDVITVALSPDNLNASSRIYAGNHDCLVVGVNPHLDDGYNTVTIEIIPDRTPLEQQAAVRTGAYTTVSREKSSIDIINDKVDDNLLLTGNLSVPSITVVADSAGVVSDFNKATGTFNVKYSGTDVTGNGPVYSVVSQTNCTGTIDASTGIYAVTALSADVGILLIRATYQGKTFETAFTVTKSYTGDTGITVSLTSDNIVFNYNSTPAPSSSEVVATIHNYTGTLFYEFSVDGTIKQNTESNTYTYTPKALYADMPDNIIVKVRKGTADGDIIAIDSLDMYAIKDGTDGTNGINSATVHLYQQASSAPAVPTATLTYTFATGALAGTLGSWSTTPPAASTTPTYMIIAVAASSGATDTITTAEWSTPVIYTKTGINGNNGTSITISSQAVTYQSSTSGTTTPTGTWLTSPPTVAEGHYLWTRTIVTYSDATSTTAYSVSYIGTNGINGMTIIQQNPSQSVPADSAGTVSSYTGTGNVLRVFEGSTELQAVTGTPAAGQYKVTAAGTNITAGAVSVSGLTAVIAVSSAMTSGTSVLKATVTYTITGKRANGTDFSTTMTQSITKAVAGNDSTAITITDPASTTPESGMYYDNTYYGIYNGVWYKWSWTNTTAGAWTQVSAEYPTNIAVRYSFDEMPDYPDNSGAYYRLASPLLAQTTYEFLGFSVNSYQGKTLIIKAKGYATVGGTKYPLLYLYATNWSWARDTGTDFNHYYETEHVYAWDVPANSSNTYRLGWYSYPGTGTGSANLIDFYVGDGTTSQPVIDNVSGSVNAIANGVVSVPGVSGKACQFLGVKALQLDLSKYANVQSWETSVWVNLSDADFVNYRDIFNSGKETIQCRTGGLLCFSYNGKTYFASALIPQASLVGDWHLITVQTIINNSTSASKKLYLDGTLFSSVSSTADFTSLTFGTCYIGGVTLTLELLTNSQIDDFQFFTRSLSASEHLGLYLSRGNTQKLYQLANYQNDQAASNGVISTTEKTGVLSLYKTIYGLYTAIIATAATYSVSHTALDTSYNTLYAYLYTSPGVLVDFTVDTTINATTYQGLWTDFYAKYSDLQTAITNSRAASEADDAQTAAQTFASGLNTQLAAQTDHALMIWSQASTSDPSSTWTTDALKTAHNGDYWYKTNLDTWWRYARTGVNTGAWSQITASATVTWLNASKTASSKSTIWPSYAAAQASSVAGDLFLDSANTLGYGASVEYVCLTALAATYKRITPHAYGSLASAPSSGMIANDSYYNSTNFIWYRYSGSAWVASSGVVQYTLTADHTSFSKSRAGVVTPSTITASAKAGTAAYAGRFKIYTTLDSSVYTLQQTSGSDQSSSAAYTLPSTGIVGVRTELYAAGGTTTLLATHDYPVPYGADVAPISWGTVTAMPTSGIIKGDWALWGTTTTGSYTKGRLYMYDGVSSWTLIDATTSSGKSYYMSNLDQILALMSTGDGYFGDLFCSDFFANSATISALQTKTITLTTSGNIKSANYVASTTGFYIDYGGTADFNGNTHIGGILTVDGDATFGESTVLKGYSQQGELKSCNIGYISFIYYNSSEVILKASSNVFTVVRFSKGKYILLLNSINPAAADWNVGVMVDVLYASDVSHCVVDGPFISYQGNHFQQVSVRVADVEMSNGQYIFEDTALVNYSLSGVIQGTWPFPCALKQLVNGGNTKYAIGLCFTDYNADEYVDPLGGCVLVLKGYTPV